MVLQPEFLAEFVIEAHLLSVDDSMQNDSMSRCSSLTVFERSI